jgi:hypothetical protein
MLYRRCHAAVVSVCALATAVLFSGSARAKTTASLASGAPSGSTAAGGAEGSESSGDGLLGPVRIGAFGGVGFPRPVTVEGMIKIGKLVGIGLEYGTLPQTTISGASVGLSAIAADVRVFPMKNGFFLGVAAGHQQLTAQANVTLPAGLGSLAEQISGDTWFVNPRVGFLWTWSWGLTIGLDVGAQIPVTSSVTSTIPASVTAGQTALNIANVFAGDVIPTVGLLRAGLLF